MLRICVLCLMLIIFNSVDAQNWDIQLLRKINTNRNQSLDGTFKLISKTATPFSVGTPLALGVIGIIKKDSGLIRDAIKAGVSITVTMTLSTVLKYSINRTRPYKTYPDIEPLTTDFTPSFPSGHTSSAFSTATTLSLIYPKWYIILPAYTWASGVAYSRLHMGMHYPSDILGGIIIGMGSAYLSYWLQNKLYSKKRKVGL
jgi:membrane-associated phospholipid phosphatase